MKFSPGLTSKVDFVRALDGDTIEFSLTRQFTVRVCSSNKDFYFDTPETTYRAKSKEEKELGLKAKAYVEDVLLSAHKIYVHIPAGKKEEYLGDSLAVGTRVAGVVIIEDEDGTQHDLAELVKSAGLLKENV